MIVQVLGYLGQSKCICRSLTVRSSEEASNDCGANGLANNYIFRETFDKILERVPIEIPKIYKDIWCWNR